MQWQYEEYNQPPAYCLSCNRLHEDSVASAILKDTVIAGLHIGLLKSHGSRCKYSPQVGSTSNHCVE